jgi:endonuclease-3
MVKKPRKVSVKFAAQQCLKLADNPDNLVTLIGAKGIPPSGVPFVYEILRKYYKPVPLEIFGSNPYKTLISTVLSSRTNDDTTLLASKRLFKVARNLEQLDQLEIKAIEKLIYPVGFYKTKALHLKKLAEIILKDFDGKIPDNCEGLMRLPGVGRKTANLVLNRAFGIPAIAVDTHVHRITNMIGWVNTRTPAQTEIELMKILPKKYWADTNKLFVSLGRQIRSKKKLREFLEKEGLF